jgi:exodeoxyribonuclease VII small subunit
MADKDIAKLSFEEAMARLEKIVDALDSGDVPLEKSIEIYEQGAALQRHCEDKLKQAEMRVQKIVTAADGSASGVEDTSFD